jgi:asparagine synthase (glutamine-hydrolysing)
VCGIVGIRDPESAPDATLACARRMAAAVRHRGPDGDGFFSEHDVALGMRRLAIIDLVTGDQPVYSDDESVVAVFNGEIYNYRELRAELAAAGRRFATRSDSEVIAQGFAQWGENVFARLNGMFAIALLERRRRQLYLARDHAGIKPLYFAWDGRRLAFGSEIKALLASNLVPRNLDFDGLAEFLAWEYVPCPRTLFQGIRKLPPATFWRLDLKNDAAKEIRYWALPRAEEGAGSAPEWIDRLDATLSAAVRRQMVSDVPLGAFLSGGVDSSLIAAEMGRPKTFSIGFDDGSYNELEHSRRVARQLGCDHVTELVQEGVLDVFPELLEMLDDPIADTSLLPTYELSKLARRHVTVALSGDGADELFGGYETYRALSIEALYRGVPAAIRKGIIEPGVGRLRPRPDKKGFLNRAIRFVQGLDRPGAAGHAKWRMYLDGGQANDLLTPAAAQAASDALQGGLVGHLGLRSQAQTLDDALRADYRSFLLDDILVKLDRSSMAVSLEARVPYLDREVVELAFRMPASMKIRSGTSKWILKQVASRRLPSETVHRTKEGFSAPVKQWLAGRGRELMEDLLDENVLVAQRIFQPAAVRRLKSEHVAGLRNHAHLLWSLMVFQGWRSRWLDSPTRVDATPPAEPRPA